MPVHELVDDVNRPALAIAAARVRISAEANNFLRVEIDLYLIAPMKCPLKEVGHR